jgi:hypothetical protein
MPKSNIKNIQIGDTILFWMFCMGFTKSDEQGTVSEIKQIALGGELKTAFTVREMPGKLILPHQITATERTKKSAIAQLKHTIEVMESIHVQSVEVAMEEETESMRVYSAITRQCNQPHRYTVRVIDAYDEILGFYREPKCTCVAASLGKKCRHILKVLEVDSDKTGRALSYGYIGDYSAHRYVRAA